MEDFVHLHVHTQYSILDGQASIPRLVDKAINDGMRGIAVTDHGNMMGIKEFYNYVNKKNKGKAPEEKFKPIIGCEMYMASRRLFNKEGKEDQKAYHLVVLAKNLTGYHNLVKLVSKAWTEGYYYYPRTDKVELEKHKDGLIICSACLGGEIPQLIKNGNFEEAERTIQWFQNTFGEDFYLEEHKQIYLAMHELFLTNSEMLFDILDIVCSNL